MIVKNMVGSSDNSCRCLSWLEHWSRFSGQQPSVCCVMGCMNRAEVGAHVTSVNSLLNTWLIVPMCNRHNMTDGELTISDSSDPVSANVSETCGKPGSLFSLE